MELWVFPPLLVMNPKLARAAMDYRFDRLAKARQKAENFGCRGTMFPWESDDSGEEATTPSAVCGRACRGRRRLENLAVRRLVRHRGPAR